MHLNIIGKDAFCIRIINVNMKWKQTEILALCFTQW